MTTLAGQNLFNLICVVINLSANNRIIQDRTHQDSLLFAVSSTSGIGFTLCSFFLNFSGMVDLFQYVSTLSLTDAPAEVAGELECEAAQEQAEHIPQKPACAAVLMRILD